MTRKCWAKSVAASEINIDSNPKNWIQIEFTENDIPDEIEHFSVLHLIQVLQNVAPVCVQNAHGLREVVAL